MSNRSESPPGYHRMWLRAAARKDRSRVAATRGQYADGAGRPGAGIGDDRVHASVTIEVSGRNALGSGGRRVSRPCADAALAIPEQQRPRVSGELRDEDVQLAVAVHIRDGNPTRVTADGGVARRVERPITAAGENRDGI